MKNGSKLAGIVMMCVAGAAYGQTGYSIVGGLSNFDVRNHCDEPCDEFEIEIEDMRPEDVIHTYRNPNYGNPTITTSPSGTGVLIDYRNPQHLSQVGLIEHFGVSLRNFNPANLIRVRWMRNGAPALVNGSVPGPGGSTPATQPVMPSIAADVVAGATGDGIMLTVTNNDPQQGIWIKRRAQVTTGGVTLESLMRNDPVVTTSYPIDAAPVYLESGSSMTFNEELVEIEDNQSVVFSSLYYQDVTMTGPFNAGHAMGAELGNVMTATLASPDGTCAAAAPMILEQPLSQTGEESSTINLRVQAESEGDTTPLVYQWLRGGVPIVESDMYHAVDTDELSIEEVTSESEGLYQVRVSNLCGSVISDSALVFVTGHNAPPPRARICDSLDFNNDGNIDPTDVDAYFSVLGENDCVPSGMACNDLDFNNDGNIDPTDVDAYFSILGEGPCI